MPGPTSPAPAVRDDDLLVLLVLATVLLGSIGGIVSGAWTVAQSWLLEHHVVVPAAADPILALPGGAGIGLDLPRLTVAVGVLVAAAAAGLSVLRGRLQRGNGEQK